MQEFLLIQPLQYEELVFRCVTVVRFDDLITRNEHPIADYIVGI